MANQALVYVNLWKVFFRFQWVTTPAIPKAVSYRTPFMDPIRLITTVQTSE